MSSEKKFSRISVTSDEDDDVVIHAGVVPAPAYAGESEAAVAEEPVVAFEELVEEQAPVAAEPEFSVEAVSEPAAVEAAARRKRAKDEYRETTLEDLEVGSMSTMQKGIIAVAVVLVIVFVVYLLV